MKWRLGVVTTGVMMVFLVACGNNGNANSGAGTTTSTTAAPTTSTSTTTTAPTTTTSAPTTTSGPTTSHVTSATYQTGQPDVGFSTYDLFTGSCSTFVAVYKYSFMGTVEGPTPTRIPAGAVVQVGSATRVPAPLPGGVPYPNSGQAGVLRNSRYSLVSSQCG